MVGNSPQRGMPSKMGRVGGKALSRSLDCSKLASRSSQTAGYHARGKVPDCGVILCNLDGFVQYISIHTYLCTLQYTPHVQIAINLLVYDINPI